MNYPSLLIKFDPDTWAVIDVFPICDSNEEADKLQVISGKMLAAVTEDEADDAA